MLLIALVALPLAWYAHRVREWNRLQAQAEAWREAVVEVTRATLKYQQPAPPLAP
jgi:hypothetical protein